VPEDSPLSLDAEVMRRLGYRTVDMLVFVGSIGLGAALAPTSASAHCSLGSV